LENLAARYARRTNRQLEHLRSFGLALGGEAGARLAQSLGFSLSSTTLLRLLRALPLPQFETPRVLGVDEWALRKGHNYGTLLYDLERHRPIELLEGRSPRSFADWLVAHPGIEIISRDRSSGYGEGAKLGAPKAIQVADRWHLWQNLSDCVKRLLGGYYTPITDFYKAHPLPPSSSPPAEATLPPVQLSPKPASKVGSRPGELKPIHPPSQVRRQLRLHIYEQVKSLKAQGLSNNEIARQLKVHKQTVRRYVAAPHFPEQAPPSFKKTRTSQLQPYHPYLLGRWKAGCHNHRQLWRELVEQGYGGGFVGVYIYIRQRREEFPLEFDAAEVVPAKKEFKSRGAVPTLRQISWWITSQREKLEERQQVGLQSLLEQWPELEKVYELVQEFAKIMRERQVGKLKEWVGKAEASDLKELAGFANGIRRDQEAVEASLKYPWSNGPVEGSITRLKLIKRQGYGRAKLDLLKVRVIMAA
jgi:transposase